jgi:hypothetical protein
MKHRIVSAIMLLCGSQRTIGHGRAAAMHALAGHRARSLHAKSVGLRPQFRERGDAPPHKPQAEKDQRP